MSAFRLSALHIATMVDAALLHRMGSFHTVASGFTQRHTVSYENREEICAMLERENILSLEDRYGKDRESATNYTAVFPRHPSKALNLSPVALLKAINCYEYQSCEHEGWRTSPAAAFCEALKGTLIHKLPGYDSADTWGLS
ncbi:MAG: hypothetical protein WAV09_03145 [Minisyncoccia bacterium]